VQLRVTRVIDETIDAKSFVLETPTSLSYRAGQFLTIAVPSERAGAVARCYSLSSAPHENELTITVKRTVDGYGSNWLCDNVQAGQTITALPPSGAFTPASYDSDLLLFAAGSGITPVISIAKAALAGGQRNVVLLYANRDERSVIFARQLVQIAEQFPHRFLVVHWLEALQSLPSERHIHNIATHFHTYDSYICGPAPFMSTVMGGLAKAGFPSGRCHREVFRSLSANPFTVSAIDEPSLNVGEWADGTSVVGDCGGSEFAFDDWRTGTSLLDFLLSKEIKAPYSCRSGECGACCFRILDGEVQMAENNVLDEDETAQGYRLACQASPVTDSIRITYE
jgi:3-ketosteroid 9alpha-monooxygenase subunit B